MRAFPAALGLLLTPTAWAEEVAAGPAVLPAYYLGQLLVSLLVVVALIYAVSYALRRWTPGALLRPQGGPVRVLQSVPLGSGHSLHVVQVGTRTLLVGTGHGGVRTLAEWAEEASAQPQAAEETGSD